MKVGKEVLGAGLVAVDHIFKSKTRAGVSGRCTYLGSTGGGSVSNTLCMLSLLGHKTHVFGKVGNDYSERIAVMDFAKFNVDHSLLLSKGGVGDHRQTRQFSHVIYADGRHSFKEKCLRCEHPFRREFQMTQEDLSRGLMTLAREVDVVHIDRANQATKKLAMIAAESGHKVSFDMGFESYGDYGKSASEIIGLSSLVKVTEPVFERHIGARNYDGVRLWWKKYPNARSLIVTRGAKGVYGFAQIGSERITFDLDGIPCEHFRDSAGAGDILTAVAIHSLFLENSVTNENCLRKCLGRAQALASLSCSLYGARALQFVFLNQGMSPEKIMEWANHIVETGKSGNSLFPLMGLRERDRFNNPSRLAPSGVCSVCGEPLASRLKRPAKKRNSVQHVDLGFVPWCMMDGFFVGKIQRAKLTRLTRAPTLFVGSGGSLSASTFGEQLVLRLLGRTAKALPPFEFMGLENLQDDTVVWLLSYGGTNPDIMAAARKAEELKVKNCIVLTGAKNSRLAKFAADHAWNLVFLKAEERGFVSTIGMLAMMSALVGILIPDERLSGVTDFFSQSNLYNLAKNADRISTEIVANFTDKVDATHIIALGSAWGMPALTDFESKIVEGGICTIEISELKNFTHGRYINALYHRQNRHFILFSSPPEAGLVAFFHKKLRRYFPQRLDILRTDLPDVRGGLDLVVQAMALALRLGQKAARDLLRPKYPPEARGLYGWDPWLEKRNSDVKVAQ